MHSQNPRRKEIEISIDRFKSRMNYLNGKSNKFSTYRLLVFIAGSLMTVLGFLVFNAGWIFLIISLLAFGVTVHLHNKLLEGIRRCHYYLMIKEANLARMNIDWDKIPEPIINTSAVDMTSEKDLDLSGKYSFHNYCDQAISEEGSSLLRKWLTNYSPDGTVDLIQRQQIIKELSGLAVFRDKFLLKAKLVSKKHLDCRAIIEWLENSERLRLPSWLLPVSAILIAAYIVLFIFNGIYSTGSSWIFIFIIYFYIYSVHRKKIEEVAESSGALENNLRKVTELILYINRFSFDKYPAVKKFLYVFSTDKSGAADKLKNMQKYMSALRKSENLVFRIILNVLFPYDVYFCKKLIKARESVEQEIPVWLETINELECLISLSNFYYINPTYVFPEFETGRANVFKVESLGHPLINERVRITNDFSFDNKKENEIVIITGSNMSGKSTFLKTVGINLCLAYAGAPVCANNFHTSLYGIFTCIKVNDSVVEGISYFYAEVKKLKQLLDRLEKGDSLKKFYLIDEIFKGTNNKERLAGSRAFIKKLSGLNGTGFISTHDLELVSLEKEITGIENYHFREEISEGKMIFDYKIHKGPCPTTNALKIMQISGLPVE